MRKSWLVRAAHSSSMLHDPDDLDEKRNLLNIALILVELNESEVIQTEIISCQVEETTRLGQSHDN